MSSEAVIQIENVSKVYQVFDDPRKRLKQLFDGKKRYEEFPALKPLSLDIYPGDTVGLVGRNGSGKSTLLQIIAGTLSPTSGSVHVNGRVAALLELGSGFNPEFTGVENVYLNGAMMGLSRTEMVRRMPIIKEFADIGDYIHRPVKTYSSGMFARLAFSVAINVDPDILIVDEILAVGDIGFQAKCVARLRQMKDNGLTLLFVSHSVDAIKSLCNRAVLMEKGSLVDIGNSEEITNKYLAKIREDMNREILSEVDIPEESDDNKTATHNQFRYGNGEVFFESVTVENSEGVRIVAAEHAELIKLRCNISAKINANDVNVSFLVRDITGVDLFGTTLFDERQPLLAISPDEQKEVVFQFPTLLRPGSYSISVAVNSVKSRDYSDVYLFQQIDAVAAFQVLADLERPIHYKFHVPVRINIQS